MKGPTILNNILQWCPYGTKKHSPMCIQHVQVSNMAAWECNDALRIHKSNRKLEQNVPIVKFLLIWHYAVPFDMTLWSSLCYNIMKFPLICHYEVSFAMPLWNPFAMSYMNKYILLCHMKFLLLWYIYGISFTMIYIIWSRFCYDIYPH